jgi:hypothetical protein
MKISFNKSLTTNKSAPLTEGRYIGTVIQIASLGDQPGYQPGEPAYPALGVVIQLAGTQIAKRMRLSESPLSTTYAFLGATLPDPENYDGDDPLPLTLGRPVAIEVTVKGQYANIAEFSRPEAFELADAPKVIASDLLMLDDPDVLQGESGKTLFLKLHRDIRSWLSKRVRG